MEAQVTSLFSREQDGPRQQWAPRGTPNALQTFSMEARPALEATSDPDWGDRVQIDLSMEAHLTDINDFGDGAAGFPRGASDRPAVLQSAQRKLQRATKPMGQVAQVAAKALVQIGAALQVSTVAKVATAALGSGPLQSSWTVMDNAAEQTRTIRITAGADVRDALQSRSGLVPFEGNRSTAISPTLQMEARLMSMQLTPVIGEAAESGMDICLTGEGAGGSLASVVALMCASRGASGASCLDAVVFNPLPAIGEVVDGEWCDARGCSIEDEQGVLDQVFARGLMADLGLPSATIKSVMLVPGPSSGKEGSSPDLVSRLGNLAARAGLAAATAKAGLPTAKVEISSGGGKLTVFKPLGVVLAMGV